MRPEQVDEAGPVVQLLDVFLVAGDRPPLDAKNLEEVAVEGLGFALLVGGICIVIGETSYARPDFVEAQAHVLNSNQKDVSKIPWAVGQAKMQA